MAISFNSLGNLGRIINQMFQLAPLLGIAANRGYDIIIPPKNVFGGEDVNLRQSDNNIFNTLWFGFPLTHNTKVLFLENWVV